MEEPTGVDNCPYAAVPDVDSDECVYSFSGLIDLVVMLVNEEVISEQIKNSLLSKVGNAESSFDRGNVCRAMHKLSALKKQVDVQKGKKISADAATQLIVYSDNLSLYLLSQLPTGETCD